MPLTESWISTPALGVAEEGHPPMLKVLVEMLDETLPPSRALYLLKAQRTTCTSGSIGVQMLPEGGKGRKVIHRFRSRKTHLSRWGRGPCRCRCARSRLGANKSSVRGESPGHCVAPVCMWHRLPVRLAGRVMLVVPLEESEIEVAVFRTAAMTWDCRNVESAPQSTGSASSDFGSERNPIRDEDFQA